MIRIVHFFIICIFINSGFLISEASSFDAKSLAQFTKDRNVKPDDVKTAIDVLQDKGKRDVLLKTLRGIQAANETINQPQQTSAVTKTFDSFSDQILHFMSQCSKLFEDLTATIAKLEDFEVSKKVLFLIAALCMFIVFAFFMEKAIERLKKNILHRFPISTLTTVDRVGSVAASFISTLLSSGILLFIAQKFPDFRHPLQIFVHVFIVLRLISIVAHQIIFYYASEPGGSDHQETQDFMASRKNYFRHLIFLAWGVAILVFAGAILAAIGLPQESIAFLKKLIQSMAFIIILVSVWELRYSHDLKLFIFDHWMENAPDFLKPLTRVLSKHYHYFFTLIIAILLYSGVEIFDTIHNPFQAFVGGVFMILTWSAGKYGIDLFSKFLSKQQKNRSMIVASLAQSHVMVIAVLRITWYLFIAGVILNLVGIDVLDYLSDSSIQPHIRRFISVIMILLVIRLVWIAVNHMIDQRLKVRKIGNRFIEPTQFVKTMAPIFRSLIHWLLVVFAGVLTLEEFGMPVLPIFYGVGFLGIAVSLGAQSLVKDFINGFFTLMEGNIAVGEVVSIGTNTGTVESLSLRGVVLRHSNGALQTIPFSEVTSIINRSRDYMIVTIDLAVSLKADIQTVDAVLQEAYQAMTEDTFYQSMIIAPIVISGVDKISDHAVHVIANIRIKPDPTNKFIRAFNRKLKICLQNAPHILPEPTVVNLLPKNVKA